MLCPSTSTSAVVSSIPCLKSVQVPLRLETNRTVLLSDSQAVAIFPFASSVSRRGVFHFRMTVSKTEMKGHTSAPRSPLPCMPGLSSSHSLPPLRSGAAGSPPAQADTAYLVPSCSPSSSVSLSHWHKTQGTLHLNMTNGVIYVRETVPKAWP